MKLVLFFSSILFLLSFSVWSDDPLTVVAVGEAQAIKEKIIFSDVSIDGGVGESDRKLVRQLVQVIVDDFGFYKNKFEVKQDVDYFKGEGALDDWIKKIGDFLISSSVRLNTTTKESKKDGKVVTESVTNSVLLITAFDLRSRRQIFSREINLPGPMEMRKEAHQLAHEIYAGMTGKESIFKTRIAFVSDRDSSGVKVVKELYIMDFDGNNKRRLTYHNAIVVSPAISSDGNRILYTLIKKGHAGIKTAKLFMLDLQNHSNTVVSGRPGVNSGAVFVPGTDDILLSLSFSGNTEIYRMNLKSDKIDRLTKHFREDVDPSLSADGYTMTFLSGRSGRAMIYTMDVRGMEKDVTRISYVGKFNAAPRFNPLGDEIVFSSWSEQEHFDLYRINKDGSGLYRLTKNFGSNEEPTYSNDGQFIAFASLRVLSKRSADQNIYIMDREGEIVKQITSNFGKCTSPRWSMSLKSL